MLEQYILYYDFQAYRYIHVQWVRWNHKKSGTHVKQAQHKHKAHNMNCSWCKSNLVYLHGHDLDDRLLCQILNGFSGQSRLPSGSSTWINGIFCGSDALPEARLGSRTYHLLKSTKVYSIDRFLLFDAPPGANALSIILNRFSLLNTKYILNSDGIVWCWIKL